MAEVRKLRAVRAVNDVLHHRNGPDITPVHDLPLNSKVLIWRKGNTGLSGFWTGPYRLLAIEGETCRIQLLSGSTAFRSTIVKPYLRSAIISDIDPELSLSVSVPTETQ